MPPEVDSTPSNASAGFKKLAAIYKASAFTTFNALILFVLLNVGLGIAYAALDWSRSRGAPVDSRLSAYRERFADMEAYSRISKDDANKFLDEQDAKGSIGFRFDPWTQFREPAFKGQFLNIDERGFRQSRAPKLRDGKPVGVFVFGGSTTFGYGVPDDHTIPSYLQSALEAKHESKAFAVRNFGQGYFYSSQELALFIHLVRRGEVPDVAVFVDGGNDLAQLSAKRDEPILTPPLEWMWNSRTRPVVQAASTFAWLPMMRVARSVKQRLFPPNAAASQGMPPQHEPIRTPDSTDAVAATRADFVTSHYVANLRIRQSICKQYNIRCVFVWQPHVSYKYDSTLHRNFPWKGRIPQVYGEVFRRMSEFKDPEYLYLGDILDGVKTKVFVDDVHYNEEWNDRIAQRIASVVKID